jgi:hypothetical protein
MQCGSVAWSNERSLTQGALNMGVDIILHSRHQQVRRVWLPRLYKAKLRQEFADGDDWNAIKREISTIEEKLDEWYIRDKHGSPFLSAMGLGWGCVADMIVDQIYLPVEGSKALLRLVEARPITAANVARVSRERMNSGSLRRLTNELMKERRKLIRILKAAIENGEELCYDL